MPNPHSQVAEFGHCMCVECRKGAAPGLQRGTNEAVLLARLVEAIKNHFRGSFPYPGCTCDVCSALFDAKLFLEK